MGNGLFDIHFLCFNKLNQSLRIILVARDVWSVHFTFLKYIYIKIENHLNLNKKLLRITLNYAKNSSMEVTQM